MINLLFGVWEIIGLENEKIRGVSEVLGVNKNSPRYDGEGRGRWGWVMHISPV